MFPVTFLDIRLMGPLGSQHSCQYFALWPWASALSSLVLFSFVFYKMRSLPFENPEVLKCEWASESPRGLLKPRFLGSTPEFLIQ